jgi:ATP-dependent DNA helicase RecG
MRVFSFFLASVTGMSEQSVTFDLYHIVKRPHESQQREKVKTQVTLPRHYFDHLVKKGVLEVQGIADYQPQAESHATVGMNIRSIGPTVLFDMCFSPQTYNLWQHADAAIPEIALPSDIFEEYVYRLGALSRYRYLGKVDDPVTAVALGESDMIEFKRDFLHSKHAIVKTVVAFANSNNGNLYLGIDDEGNIIGVNEELALYGDIHDTDGRELPQVAADKYILAITQYIENKITPMLSPFPKITLKKTGDKYVVHIFVETNSDLICGLDKEGEKFVAIRTNNRSVIVKDPHQIGEIYVRRRLGGEMGRRLGLL